MIHFKALPVLNILVKQTRDDTDMKDDIEFLHDKLNLSVQNLRWGDVCCTAHGAVVTYIVTDTETDAHTHTHI